SRWMTRGNGASAKKKKPRPGSSGSIRKSSAETSAAVGAPHGRTSRRSRVPAAVAIGSLVCLLRHEREQRDRARPLDGERHLALMLGAGAEHAARKDLAPVGNEAGQRLHVLRVDV